MDCGSRGSRGWGLSNRFVQRGGEVSRGHSTRRGRHPQPVQAKQPGEHSRALLAGLFVVLRPLTRQSSRAGVSGRDSRYSGGRIFMAFGGGRAERQTTRREGFGGGGKQVFPTWRGFAAGFAAAAVHRSASAPSVLSRLGQAKRAGA